MAYKTIDETFWTDPDVRELSYKGKFLFLYLVTNPHCHYSGVYYLPELFIHIETGLPLKDIKAGLRDLTKEGFIKYDPRRSVIWITKMARYQIKGGASNKNMMDGIANHLKTLHKTPLIKDFLQYYNDFKIPLESPLEDPSEPLAESGEGECIKDKDKDKEKDKKVYGEFQNVLLTDKEFQKLVEKFGEPETLKLVERMSTGIASKGYKYKSHYATALTWKAKNSPQGASNGTSRSTGLDKKDYSAGAWDVPDSQ